MHFEGAFDIIAINREKDFFIPELHTASNVPLSFSMGLPGVRKVIFGLFLGLCDTIMNVLHLIGIKQLWR